MNTDVMFSSKTDQWSTPPIFFNTLNDEFHFSLDACASSENAKCVNYYTKEQNSLIQDWTGTIWCNPPYGREISKWIKKGYCSSINGNTVVMLLPARTDTKWFHEYIYNKPNVELRFIKGRLKFGDCKNAAPFPSMVVIFRPLGEKGEKGEKNG